MYTPEPHRICWAVGLFPPSFSIMKHMPLGYQAVQGADLGDGYKYAIKEVNLIHSLNIEGRTKVVSATVAKWDGDSGAYLRLIVKYEYLTDLLNKQTGEVVMGIGDIERVTALSNKVLTKEIIEKVEACPTVRDAIITRVYREDAKGNGETLIPKLSALTLSDGTFINFEELSRAKRGDDDASGSVGDDD